ncbi:MAG: NfeD family protein [Acidiferrobacteraceae bacterium]
MACEDLPLSHRLRWLLCALVVFAPMAARASDAVAVALHVKGVIGPAMSRYVRAGLNTASRARARLVILEIDTPGGLETSMRKIVKAVLASPVPVVAYVAPSGARAASAGTYIFYASSIAAMAPGTNVGAATPVMMGASVKGVEARKMENDAAAYLESLATLNGRNPRFAAQAVLQSASVPAGVAVHRHIANFIAHNLKSLLAQANGREVEVRGHPMKLATTGLKVVWLHRGFSSRLLDKIGDPTVAYLLMTLGFYGLVFELLRPGLVLPGVVGAVSLLLALYAFQVLPVDYAGFGLILLGIVLAGLEAFVPAHGSLGAGGLIAMVAGSLMLFGSPGAVPLALVLPSALVLAAGVAALAIAAVRTRRQPLKSGAADLMGALAVVMQTAPELRVKVHGEDWRAESPVALAPGDSVRVTSVRGLTLQVARLNPGEDREVSKPGGLM